jgi:hypothetical protein
VKVSFVPQCTTVVSDGKHPLSDISEFFRRSLFSIPVPSGAKERGLAAVLRAHESAQGHPDVPDNNAGHSTPLSAPEGGVARAAALPGGGGR